MQASRRGSFAAYPQDPEPRFPGVLGHLAAVSQRAASAPLGCQRCQPGQAPHPTAALPPGPLGRSGRIRSHQHAEHHSLLSPPRSLNRPRNLVSTERRSRRPTAPATRGPPRPWPPHMPHRNRSSLSAMPGNGVMGPLAPKDGAKGPRTPVKTRRQRGLWPPGPERQEPIEPAGHRPRYPSANPP